MLPTLHDGIVNTTAELVLPLVSKFVLRISAFGLLVSSKRDRPVEIRNLRHGDGRVVGSALLVCKVGKGKNKGHKREGNDSHLCKSVEFIGRQC